MRQTTTLLRPCLQTIFQHVAPVLLACLLSLGCQAFGAEPTTPEHTFGVRDAIAMQEFVTYGAFAGSWGQQLASFSPDGRYFAVITQRGLLASNERESTIWTYNVDAVRGFVLSAAGALQPEPRMLARLAATSNEPTISAVRWSADGKALLFLGRNQIPEGHIYSVDVETGALRQLTPDGQDVTSFTARAGSIVYTILPAYKPAKPIPIARVATGHSIFSLLFPDETARHLANQCELGMIRESRPSLVTDPRTARPIRVNYNVYQPEMWISPSGHLVAITRAVEQIPPAWETYQPRNSTLRLKTGSALSRESYASSSAKELELIDLSTGDRTALVNAPIGDALGYYGAGPETVIWSRDGSQLLLTNIFLPLEGISEADRARRARTPMIVLYNVQTRSVTEVAPIKSSQDDEKGTGGRVAFAGVSWNEGSREVVVRYVRLDIAGSGQERAPSEVYRLGRDGWTFAGTRRERDSGPFWMRVVGDEPLRISVQQNPNMPPVLCAASDAGDPRSIWDPNPQLNDLALGEAALYHWKDQQGRQLEGVLVKPPGYIPGRRYPLVIQSHNYGGQFEHKKFIGTGVYGTAWVGRALAARGVLVLQMASVAPTLDAQDAPRKVAIYEALIAQLAAEGMADPNRVGAIGFSYDGYYVLNALAKHPRLFAAATVADNNAYDIMQDLLAVDGGNPDVYFNQFALVLGGQPFGDGLKHWAENSPFFSFDQVVSPLRIELHSRASLLAGWGQYAALRQLNKPVELIQLPDASHDVVKPLERLESQGGDVDWFDFWLNGHEEPDPAKAEQYARWRELRKLQEQNEAKPQAGSAN